MYIKNIVKLSTLADDGDGNSDGIGDGDDYSEHVLCCQREINKTYGGMLVETVIGLIGIS